VLGFIAQEAEQVVPGMVMQTRGEVDGKRVDDMRAMCIDPVVALLVTTCQNLVTRVDALEALLAKKLAK
jgi:hypothetical protein